MESFSANNTIENPIENEVQQLQQSIEQASEKISHIDESRLSPEKKTAFQAVKERVKRITSKVAKTVGYVSIIGASLIEANQVRVHSDLKITTEQGGSNKYEHEDERTTHLLNILAGKETFTESDMRMEFNNLIEYACDKKNVVPEKKIVEMTTSELELFLMEHFKEIFSEENKFKPGDLQHEFDRKLSSLNTPIDSSDYVPHEKLYELLWQLEQEAGNPIIRFRSEEIGFSPLSSFKGLAHYDPVNNVVYVSMNALTPESSRELVAELAHGKQFNEKPIGTSLQYVSDVLGAVQRSEFSVKKFSDEYRSLYSRTGSVEQEAHQTIESYFKDKYPLFSQKEESGQK